MTLYESPKRLFLLKQNCDRYFVCIPPKRFLLSLNKNKQKLVDYYILAISYHAFHVSISSSNNTQQPRKAYGEHYNFNK